MKDRFLSFRPEIKTLPESLKLIITSNAYNSLSKLRGDDGVIKTLCALSKSTLLLTIPLASSDERASETGIGILTDFGLLRCAADYDDQKKLSLIVKSFDPISLFANNTALKSGITFRVPESGALIFRIRLKNIELYCDIVDGQAVGSNSRESFTLTARIQYTDPQVHFLDAVFEKSVETMVEGVGNPRPVDEDEEEFVPEESFRSLLHTASQYAIYEYEAERKNAEASESLVYTRIEAVEKDTEDRRTYRFILQSPAKGEDYAEGARVEVVDRHDKRHTAEVKTLTDEYIELLFSRQEDVGDLQNGYITLSVSRKQMKVMLSAINKLLDGTAPAQYMNGVFGSRSYRKFNTSVSEKTLKKKYEEIKEDCERRGEKYFPPNPSQLKAIVNGINSGDIYLVMGPPGTGKTTVILEWVKYFVKKDMRVLISSQNNKAVDNVLERLKTEKDVDMIRIGSELKVQDNVREYVFENKIAAKRREIDGTCKKHLLILAALKNEWNERLSLNRDYKKAQKEYEDLKDAITRAVGIYKSRYIKCARKRSEFEIVKTEAEKRFALLQKAKETGASLSLTPEDTDRYRKAADGEYRQFLSRLTVLADEYRHLYGQMQQSYHMCLEILRTSRFPEIEQRYHTLDVQYRKNTPYRENIWGLFKKIADCRDDDGSIRAELARAQKIEDLIRGWQASMIDTQNYALDEIMLESINLVGATCIGINANPRFSELHFDVTIIDEAGQIQIHNALVPMSVSDKLIMLGDHKQIPPSVNDKMEAMCLDNNERTDYLSASLFEKMFEETPEQNKTMLDTQFRMPGQIADIISEWFYEKKYKSPDFKYEVKSLLPEISSRPFLIVDTSEDKNRFEAVDPEGGYINPLEAGIISDIVKAALRCGVSPEQIGCISAYKKQVSAMHRRMKSDAKGLLTGAQIVEMASTLDSFQGQERELIVYSFTRSSKTPPRAKRIGFLSEIRRLNVAMTRPTKMLILVGDMSFLSKCEALERDENGELTEDKSEKRFSDFMRLVIKEVRGGKGELITYDEFSRRVHGG